MQKQLPILFFFGFILLLFSQQLSAQGCVAIRPMGGCAGTASNSIVMGKGQWQLGANYRYFRSFRHFKSDTEQKERLEKNTEVINWANSLDLGISYGLSNRLSLSFNLPLIHYDRSSLYEHYGNSTTANPEQKRFNTGAQGIGDVRLSGSYWLFNPEKYVKHNIAVGLGVKLPTGDSNVKDEFHKRKATDGGDSTIIKAVDQSIQLGDGGVGISLELQGYATLFHGGALYFNGFYMSNPRETNNTINRVITANSTEIDKITEFHSVADQFVARIGMNFSALPVKNLAVGLGLRAEGIPNKDLIGGSNGFRRPGFIVSVEPGVAFQRGKFAFSVNVPYALYRKRTRSVADIAGGNDAFGIPRNGDAAFADYSVNVGLAYRFGGQKMNHSMDATPKFNDVKKMN
ncbi:MAG: transporter [Saprospiraceae bacterium]|nr:transporter [Saprospiraceae bacterium]